MAIQTTDNFPNLTTLRGIHSVILHEWEQREAQGRGIFNVYDSTQAREDTQTVGGISTMETKLEGEPINYVAFNEGFRETFTHVDYALGMRATHEMMRDELYGIMEDMGRELAFSAHATEETLLANHFNNGFTAAYAGPDGLELFSAVHVRENGDTYANELGTAADLAKSSLEQALIDFRSNFRDGGGKRLQIRPRTLLVPPDLQFTAARLLDSTQNPTVNYGGDASGDSDTAVNPINGLGLQLVVWDYLTDADAWFLMAEKRHHKLMLFSREEFNTDYIYDFDTGDYKIKGLFAQSSGWADPRGVFGTPGAG